jgi:hypothetical protein
MCVADQTPPSAYGITYYHSIETSMYSPLGTLVTTISHVVKVSLLLERAVSALGHFASCDGALPSQRPQDTLPFTPILFAFSLVFRVCVRYPASLC